jgi:hypothetical protein
LKKFTFNFFKTSYKRKVPACKPGLLETYTSSSYLPLEAPFFEADLEPPLEAPFLAADFAPPLLAPFEELFLAADLAPPFEALFDELLPAAFFAVAMFF